MMTDDPNPIRRRLAASLDQAKAGERASGTGADAVRDAFDAARDRTPLTEREKEVFRSLGVNIDEAEMSDDEWHEYVAAHNEVVRRKGPGVPVVRGEVEDEIVRRRALGDLLNERGQT